MAADVKPKPIPYVDLAGHFATERREVMAAIEKVLEGGQFVGGKEVDELEVALAAYCGTKEAIALDSGTVALVMALQALGVKAGDEVITPPNSFVASTAAIMHVGAKPIFADVRGDQNIDPDAVAAAITPRTVAIMPVHLTGRLADMGPIMALAARHKLAVVEDAAQAIGSKYDGRRAGSFGAFNCFSTHPLKNLNCPGDGGFITTNDSAAALRMRRYRNHGLIDRNTVGEWGLVARMDNIQATVLSLRLPKLEAINERKRAIAALYRKRLDPERAVIAPCRPIEYNTFQTLVIQVDRRDELQRHLATHDIQAAIHYPIPIHLQPCAAGLGYKRGQFPITERQSERILSIPSYPTMTDADVERVAATINAFYRGKG